MTHVPITKFKIPKWARKWSGETSFTVRGLHSHWKECEELVKRFPYFTRQELVETGLVASGYVEVTTYEILIPEETDDSDATELPFCGKIVAFYSAAWYNLAEFSLVSAINSADCPSLKNLDDNAERKLQELMTTLSKSHADMKVTCVALLSMLNKSWLTYARIDEEASELTQTLSKLLYGPEKDISEFLKVEIPSEEEMEQELSPFPSPLSPLIIDSPPPLSFTPPPLSPCYPFGITDLTADVDIFDNGSLLD